MSTWAEKDIHLDNMKLEMVDLQWTVYSTLVVEYW